MPERTFLPTSHHYLMPLFPYAHDFEIHGSDFTNISLDYNHGIQNFNFNSGNQDIRSRIYSAMKDHIRTDALHDSSARRPLSRCYPGTREAALRTISHWVRDSAPHCLWLHGPAGTGKTAIAQTFSENCHRDGTLGATYFFTKGSTRNPARGPPPLFSTLSYQLMSVFPGLDEHLWAVIRADRMIFEKSLSTQIDKLIVRPLLKLAGNAAPAIVIIDGLDECEDAPTQEEIARLILGLERYSLPLLFLVSSRPEPEIRRVFDSSSRSSITRLPLDKTLHPDHDIRHFLYKEFERIYVEMGRPPVSQLSWPSDKDIEKLVCKSSGHFIYAATVVRFAQEDHAHPMDQLDAILQIPSESASSSATKSIFADSIAFRELDELYLHILRKYRNRAELARILRGLMYFSHCALSDIETILNLRSGRVRIMLTGLHSIVDVPTGDELPKNLHASFNDFLADPERSQEFYLNPCRFNADLACSYARLVVAFSLSKSGYYPLTIAMRDLRGCLKASADLLSDALETLINIFTQETKHTPPCLLYIISDFLLQVLRRNASIAKPS
ncbi:hypothetical protein BD779DRAFT_283447 [Infundibulicybe gibba]|nr:hypothetical protein BD779DRAFT_283447 [Infundibulicybe gibba]